MTNTDEKTIVVDARGLSCPQPVLEAKRAIDRVGDAAGRGIDVLVDTVTSRENVTRFAQNAGWTVAQRNEEDYFRLRLTKAKK